MSKFKKVFILAVFVLIGGFIFGLTNSSNAQTECSTATNYDVTGDAKVTQADLDVCNACWNKSAKDCLNCNFKEEGECMIDISDIQDLSNHIQLPDLIVKSITFNPDKSAYSKSDLISFVVTFKNVGNSETGSFTGQYYVNDQEFSTTGTISLDSLEPGEETTLKTESYSFFWDNGKYWAKIGDNQFKVIIDHREVVAESDETNNILTKNFSLKDEGMPLRIYMPIASNFGIGETYTIQWAAGEDVLQDKINLDLYKNSVYTASIANSLPVTDKKYSWTIPASLTTGSGYTIRILDTKYPNYFVESSQFTIIGPEKLTVLSPNGGEKWEMGKSYTISWKIDNFNTGKEVYADVYIKSSKVNQKVCSPQLYFAEEVCTVSVLPGYGTGDDYKVEVVEREEGGKEGVRDASDNYFSIASSSTITEFSISITPNAPHSQNILAGIIDKELARFAFMSWDNSTTDVKVEKITFSKIGTLNDMYITNLSLYDAYTQTPIATSKTNLSSEKAIFILTTPLIIKKGTVKELSIRVDISSGATVGSTVGFQISTSDAVVVTNSVTGSPVIIKSTFPVSGELMTIKSTNLPPNINGTNGPASLKINETGTWSITVYDSDGTSLSYNVDWGDASTKDETTTTAPAKTTQKAFFRHSYSKTGTYTIIFTVTDEKGASAKSTLSVKVSVDALIISNIGVNTFDAVPPSKTTEAGITWYTNHPSNSDVYYYYFDQNNRKYENWNWDKVDDYTQTDHEIILKGLEPSTKYYFTVSSKQKEDAVKTTSELKTFMSGVSQNSQTPVIVPAGPFTISDIGTNSAAFTWETNVETQGFVYVTKKGETVPTMYVDAKDTETTVPYKTKHKITAKTLYPGITYSVYAGFTSREKITGYSGVETFTTLSSKAFVDLKINNADSLSAVPYNSIITANWSAVNVKYCSATGHHVPLVDGGLWTDWTVAYGKELPASGSKKLYARHQNFGYQSPLELTVKCVDSATGQIISDTVRVSVTSPVNKPPIVIGSSNPGALKVNEIGTWNIEVSDPDSLILSYLVKWGDGAVSELKTGPLPAYNTHKPIFSHSYAKEGNYKIIITTTDNDGASVDTFLPTVYVSNQALFSIQAVRGIKHQFQSNEKIILAVGTLEPDGTGAAQEEGFNAQAAIFDANRTKTYASVNGSYQNDGVWQVELTAPSDTSLGYILSISLYCSQDDSQCAKDYGQAAQTTEEFSFSVASNQICSLAYDPVCGSDGATWGNRCIAELNNVRVQYAGKCKQAQHTDRNTIEIKDRANLLIKDQIEPLLAELRELRNIIKEQQTKITYLEKLTKGMAALTADTEERLNIFIAYGVDESTKSLGTGERANILASYKQAFNKLPDTEVEFEDTVRIANGRWPKQRNQEMEKWAKEQFKKVYLREANLDNPNDSAAIVVMAYGLRQNAKNRNLNSERAGISIFQAIYGHTPQDIKEWNIMQAITYSGAKR